MIIVKPEGSSPCCRSEREFMRAIHDHPGVYIANVNIPNSTNPGAFTREVDGVMLTPGGIYTVEVKGLRATGELHTPRMDGWTVGDGETAVPLMGRPHSQALAHSKYLASFLKDTGVTPGWVRAVLAIVGEGITLPEDAPVHVIDNVYVVISQPGVGDMLREHVGGTISQRELSVEMVQTILTTFECVTGAPTKEELLTAGFRAEATIADEVEERRRQVREEHLAATTGLPVRTAASEQSTARTIADGPTSVEWKITTERYAAAVALDEELTETGAVVDGVAIHRRMVAYAERKGLPLTEVAAVVNNPVEILGDTTESNLIYCGAECAVSVRTLDGLAMFYKTVEHAKAERYGTVVAGVEISARAAKQAINQFRLSLEALARAASDPEESWWVSGTTDVAHARGEFVVVTSGPTGPVLYVQTRAMAVFRAAPKKPDPRSTTTSEDVVVDGLTIRAAAVGWYTRRQVSVDSIVEAALRPVAVWAGHSENMEVRCGPANAVLLDTATQTVVAVMSSAEAIEYRDGVVKGDVRLSGRCVFLAKRRKVSVDGLIAAFRTPHLIARVPGSTQSVYVGAELAVTVEDDGATIADFTFAAHAQTMIVRGELVPVDLGPLAGAPVRLVPESPRAPVAALTVPASAVPSPLRLAALVPAQSA